MIVKGVYLDKFTLQYLETLLWSSTHFEDESDNNGTPFDENYGIEDFSREALELAKTECEQFQENHLELIAHDLEQAGHDFCLTRNRHGAGFWDGDWEKKAGKILTDASHTWGSVDLYVNSNNEVEIQ